MSVEPFLARAGQLLLEYAVGRVLDTALKRLEEPGALGALILQKGIFRQVSGHLLSRARLDARGALVRQRNEATAQYIIQYQREPILLTGNLRFPYSHGLNFIQTLPSSTDPNRLKAVDAGPFSLDATIGIPGYKTAAARFRESRKHKVPFPGSTVRINKWDGNCHFELSEADYVDQFVTNQKEIVDQPLDNLLAGTQLVTPPRLKSVSLRQVELQGGRLAAFSESVLANTIGIAATVVTSDGYLILPRRNKNVHYEPGFEGCSVSGVLEWSNGLVTAFVRELEQQLTGKEGPQELVLKKGYTTVVPLAFARELQRAGKPQFFFHVWADTSLEEFKRAWRDSKYAKEEYDSIRWVRLFEPQSLKSPVSAMTSATSTLLSLLNPKAVIRLGRQGRIALNEEARANFYYLAAYLGAEKENALPKKWR